MGGFVWARADTVSHDCKRIYYGSGLKDKWLRGTVLRVIQKKPEGAKRGTTIVVARFTVGGKEYEPELSLQTLKAEDPTAAEPPAPPNNGAEPNIPPIEIAENTIAPAAVVPPVPPVLPATGNEEEENSDDDNSSGRLDRRDQQRPVATCHGRNWYNGPTDVDVNGATPHRVWKMTCQYTGYGFTPGCDDTGVKYDESLNAFTPYDFFMACFPKDQLKFMVDKINIHLCQDGCLPLSTGELLKWFGVTILMTQFEFGDRSSLWATSCSRWNKYVPPASFGEKTGMSRQRYDDIHRKLVWSEQPGVRPEGMTSETYQWMQVDDFVDRFNEHRKKFFSASDLICVDESMSRWYGLGGSWINGGLPHFVAMDRKPDNGCEIQNSCDGRSGIMLRVKLVKTATEEERDANERQDANGYDRLVVLLLLTSYLLLDTIFLGWLHSPTQVSPRLQRTL